MPKVFLTAIYGGRDHRRVNLLPLPVMSQGELNEAAVITISMAGGFAKEATVKRFFGLY